MVKNKLITSYCGKRVFLTGHTGFKGSWMAKWLDMLGAEVTGYALPPQNDEVHEPSYSKNYKSILGDITNFEFLRKAIEEAQPEIVFHLAAQPLVRYSYREPLETYATNVMGTANVLEAIRGCDSVRAVICVTTDKVYQNKERQEGYREEDRLGGYDPYSSSKACSEMVIETFRNCFFSTDNSEGKHKALIASARGGNVIGGGDWSQDRIIPDIIRAKINSVPLEIRNPNAVRPWQHVLDCLLGYLSLGTHLLDGKAENASAYNFGPLPNERPFTVNEIVEYAKNHWPSIPVISQPSSLHETTFLSLNCNKAVQELKWNPFLSTEEAVNWTFDWYNAFFQNECITEQQINTYQNLMG
ncbi:CDP-glucose 4,6-dehydratase [Wandonia haliotis]